MQLGMIGLGRMGGNIVRRLIKHGRSAAADSRHKGLTNGGW
jgi:6-phosphogluconate dehydrogenase (decarboxylating)